MGSVEVSVLLFAFELSIHHNDVYIQHRCIFMASPIAILAIFFRARIILNKIINKKNCAVNQETYVYMCVGVELAACCMVDRIFLSGAHRSVRSVCINKKNLGIRGTTYLS